MDEKKTRKKRGERKDGRIQVTVSIGFDKDGKRIRRSFYGQTRGEAERKRDAYIANGGMAFTGDDITVEEWVEQYKKSYRTKVNPAYLNNDDVPYNRLCKAIGKMILSSVREIDLQNALNEVAEMSDSTIDKYKQTIKRVFRKAHKNKLIASDPAEDLVVPDGVNGSHRALERWETDCILQNWRLHRAGIWAMLMLLAGLRRGELIALDWKNIDMENRQITVCEVAAIYRNEIKIEQRAKTEAGIRILPICQPLWEALDQTPKEKRTGLICVSAQGKQHTESSFSRGWEGFNLAMQRVLNGEPVVQQGRRKTLEKKIEEAEAEGRKYILFSVRCHDLRHTFATALFEAGVPIKAAQYYLGHADIRITMELYTHFTQEKERKTRSQIVSFLDGWLKLTDGQKEEDENA